VWQLLKRTYSRKTLAKSFRKCREVVNPKQVKDMGEIISAVAQWEGEVQELQKLEGLVVAPMIRLAALTEICTDEIRDMVFQSVDGCGGDIESTYKTMRVKIISWVSNRVAAKSQAVPMDVGDIYNDYNDYDDATAEVAAIGKGRDEVLRMRRTWTSSTNMPE
jgi:hypothetical protein